MIRVEEKIRDKLSLNLTLLEEGLTLLNIEEYLPNKQGTRGFIDILAKDSQNRYVIIELKRTKASSREALHEILKYIEGIKENKSLKDDEIIAYIVSTEWDELLIPFSSFISKVPYSVIGYKLEVDEEFNPILASVVNPLNLNNERFFSNEHLISFFKTKDSLEKGIKNHKDIFSKKGIEDYVLIVLKKEDYIYQSKLSGLTAQYNYILYNVAQVQSDDKYIKIIQKHDKSLYAELVETYGEGEITDLHGSAIYDCSPIFFAERYEMSYPAKLNNLFEKEGWEVEYLIRGKKLNANSLLTDETILNELQGSTGTNKQIYNKKFKSSNTTSLQQILKEIEICLVDNEIWLRGLQKALLEIEKEDEYLEGELNIYNPSNTLYSMYRFYLSGYVDEYGQVNMLKYFPHYTLNIKNEKVNRLYFGCLDYMGSNTSLQEVIEQAYKNNKSYLLLTTNWGGYESNDIDIAPLYGLEYSNYMIKKINGEDSYFKFDGFRYKPCTKRYLNTGVGEFYGNRRDFIMEVCSLFEEADLGVGFIY